jgi:hypothetical protein
VFHIGGNKYRPIPAIKYRWQIVCIRHILTTCANNRATLRPNGIDNKHRHRCPGLNASARRRLGSQIRARGLSG